jgi:tryptophan synthase alpha subunit
MAPEFRRGFPTILAFALVSVALVCRLYHNSVFAYGLTKIFLGFTQFLHKRQLQQESLLPADVPPSESSKLDSDNDEKDMEEKSVIAVAEPVKTSVL